MAEARIPQIGHTPEINQGAWPRLRIAADGSEGGRILAEGGGDDES